MASSPSFYISSSSDSDDSGGTLTVNTSLLPPPPIRIVGGHHGPGSRADLYRPTPIVPNADVTASLLRPPVVDGTAIPSAISTSAPGAPTVGGGPTVGGALGAAPVPLSERRLSWDECILFTASAIASWVCVVLFFESEFGGWLVCATLAVCGGLAAASPAPLLLYCCWTFMSCVSAIGFVAAEGVPESDIMGACLLAFFVLNAISTVCGARILSRMIDIV